MPSWPDPAHARGAALAAAGHNVARLAADAITADLSTDSVIRRPDLSNRNAGPDTSRQLGQLVSRTLGMDRWLATGSGRGAEATVAAALVEPGARVLANEVYVSGRWWIERLGGNIDGLPTALSPDSQGGAHDDVAYDDVAYVQLTLPPAQLGPTAGRSVSLDEVVAVRGWIDRCLPHAPLVIDASRLWENAAASKGAANDFAAVADIVLLSARKDLGADRGGLIATRSKRWWSLLADAADTVEAPRGGLGDRDLAQIERGLRHMSTGAASQKYDELRTIGLDLRRAGLPTLSWGCGSIFLDARDWLPDVPAHELPAQALLNVIYLLTGWRGLGTSTDEAGRPPTVRLAVRDSAASLRHRLATVAEIGSRLRSGLEPVSRDRAAPYLQPAEPTDPSEWPSAATATTGVAAGHRGSGSWVPSRGWLVGYTPPGFGPQRAVAEALAQCITGAAAANDPVVARLHQRLLRASPTPQIPTIGTVTKLDSPSDWPAVADAPAGDLLWASAPEGGMIAVRAGSTLAPLVDRASLFTLGTWLEHEGHQ